MADEMAKEDAKVQPLVIFYDSEAANGNVYCGDIIEIAAKCHPDVVKGSFESLINTKQPLCAFATQECGISEEDLENKPNFKEVLMKFVSWMDDMVKLAKKRHGTPFMPVLCAHYGYQFDFLILLSNMERSGLNHSILTQHNVHFADSLLFCREVKDNGEKSLANTRLSLDALFKKFFPRKSLKDRHRAMGDVDGMVKIFTQTPLRKLLHQMKYSSTNERLEYYCSQSASKQQQRILEEKFCKLDACSKNMSIKKLLKEGVTYNTLRKIFEECCSFLDFYETMKTYGIERKVSKIMALHFSGQGLQNEGAKAFHKLHEEKLMQPSSDPQENDKALQGDDSGQKPTSKVSATNSLQEEARDVQSEHQENDKALPCDRSRHKGAATEVPSEHQDNVKSLQCNQPEQKPPSQHEKNVKLLQCDHPGQKTQPTMSATSNSRDANPSLQVEATEDWEQEVATAAPRQGFTLKCTTPTPLSLMVEDLSAFPQPAKKIPKEKPQAKSDHSYSEKDNSKDVQVIDKRPQGKAKRAEAKNRSGQLKFNAPNQLSERNGRWKKPVRENKQEGRLKKESVFPKRGNKNETVKKKQLESTNACVSEEGLDVNEGDSSISSVPLEEIKPKTELVESRLEKSQPAVIFDQDGDSSVGDTIQKFTSIFIGDIAILVPVEGSADADSNELELNKSNQAEKETFKKCNKLVDNSASEAIAADIEKHVQSPAEAVVSKPDKVIENSQLSQELSTHNATECVATAESQSECETTHGTAGTLAQEQAEATVSLCNKVLDTSQLNLELTEENTGLSSKLSCNSQSEQMPADGHKEMSTQGQGRETTSYLAFDLEQSSGNSMTPDLLLVSSIRAEKMDESDNADKNVTRSLTVSSNNIAENVIPDGGNPSKVDDEIVEGTDHRHATLHVPTDVTSIAGQGTTCSVYSDPNHDNSAIGGSSDIGFPWKNLQQMPCSSVPGDVPLASSDPSMYGSLVMNQELSSHFISTDDVDQSHRDLQAELSSESSSTSEEQSMDAFPREPPLGAERGYTPDTVQQQAWLGNADDGIYQMSPSPGLNNYNQASFPSLHNPYGIFPHSQQLLPLLKPCYPSFAYPNHVRPVIPHQMMHHPQQVLMPPFQYRSQMMFSSMVPQSVGFPALPPSQFQPQMLPFMPTAAGYSCPSPFYSSPYQQATNTAVDINSTVLMHPTDALPQVGAAVDDYRSPHMDSNGSLDSDEREDSSSELSSSDSSLELIISSTATQMYDNSTRTAQESFPVQVESKLGFSTSVTFDGNQKETIDEQKDKGPLSGNISDCKNDGQIFSLADLCYKELSSDAVDASCAIRSKELFSQQLTEGQEDPVHKQITILSREEGGISMGRRLSPDGSSGDGICLDLPSNASPVRNNEEDFKEKRSSASHSKDLAEEISSNRPSGVEEKGQRRKDRSPSPKPQRLKGGRGRRNKNAQTSTGALQKDFLGSASGPSTQGTMSGMCTGAQSVSSKEKFDSCKQGNFHSSNIGHQTQKDRNHRRVRFSKENIELQSSEMSKTSDNPRQENTPITRQEKEKETIAPVEEKSGLYSSGNQSINDMEGNQSLSVDRTVAKITKVEGHCEHDSSRYKTGPQQHVERRANADIRPANIRAGNSRKRVFNDKTKRHCKEKQTVKDRLDVEKPEAESRTDNNNNSK